MPESPALASVHASRRAVTLALRGDVLPAARELNACARPDFAARSLLAIAVAAIRTAAEELGCSPDEVWQALARRQAGYTDTAAA